MQDGDRASPGLVSPQPSTVHVLGAALSPPRNEFAKDLPDAHDRTCRNGHHGLRTCMAGSDQAGRISEKRNSMPQNPWTKDLDEHLLHLRNVAQLKWGDLANYFPTMTSRAVKRRHKQLSDAKETTQDAGDQRSARLEKRSTAAFPAASNSNKCEPNLTKHCHATSGLPATIKLAKPCSLYANAARTGGPTIPKSRQLLHYQPLKARHSVPHAADDQFDTRSDIGSKKVICKSVERPGKSLGTGGDEAAETHQGTKAGPNVTRLV